MSYYDGRDSRGYRVKRDRYSRPGGYVEETYVDNRGGYGRELGPLRRYDDSQESVVEEVTRDFPPGEHYYGYSRPRRTMSVRESGPRRARSAGRDPYYDDEYYRRDDYRPRRSRRYPDKRDRYERRSSYSSSRSPSPRPRRRKSLSEQAVSAIGGALGVKSARDRSRDRSTHRHEDRYSDRGRSRRYRSYSDSRSRSRGGHRRAKSEARMAQAVKAALAAGAAEAFRARKDPGPWTGDKGKRILTAAISAGGVDGLIDRDPNTHGGRHVIESVLAGMATNRFVNGQRSQSQSRSGARGRSQSQGGIKDMASAGILAAAGKQIYDRVRSKSRGRSRSDSQDSYSDGRGHSDSKKRGSSVSRAINKGIAALGLDDKNKDDRRQDHSSRYSDFSDSENDDSYHRSSTRRHRSSRDSHILRHYISSRAATSPLTLQNRSFVELKPTGGKTEADLIVEELQELYNDAKDEFEIAVDSTNSATIYAASDRDSAREYLNQLLYVYTSYTFPRDATASEAEDPSVQLTSPMNEEPNFDPESVTAEVREEVKKRVGQRIRELRSGVERLEDMAGHEG
ncbi:hypothetical protein PISL3812_02262 [Talaromyces islandicus]|uniref:Uncharacterized protein n=1 Tax=Talaromyces islandicus TaxID=28573 RepID=A0A0U1LPE8_TALIS|nr:hypothetical protein PISL3812_02262 [Talaromyces islandicus]